MTCYWQPHQSSLCLSETDALTLPGCLSHADTQKHTLIYSLCHRLYYVKSRAESQSSLTNRKRLLEPRARGNAAPFGLTEMTFQSITLPVCRGTCQLQLPVCASASFSYLPVFLTLSSIPSLTFSCFTVHAFLFCSYTSFCFYTLFPTGPPYWSRCLHVPL